MRLILKMMTVPVIWILTITIWICVLLVKLSAYVFGVVSALVFLLGLAVLVTSSVPNGLILLVIAFGLSPFGVPTLAIRLLGLVQDAKEALRDFVA